mgnify:CR=1 FL=1
MSEIGQDNRIRLRNVRPEEFAECWKLILDTNLENWEMHQVAGPLPKGRDLEQHIEQLRDKLEMLFNPETDRLLVAATNEELAGVAWYSLQVDYVYALDHAIIYTLYVKKEFRRRGIALRLVNEVKKRAEKAGYKYIRLSVLHSNTPARNLYRHLGFFDETHNMICRLEPTGPEKRKAEARQRKEAEQKDDQ